MKSFKAVLLSESKKTDSRGHVSELMAHNTINRYMEHINNGLSHVQALENVSNEYDHINGQSSKHPKYQRAQKVLDPKNFDKTSRDSHTAAISIIDHLHKKMVGVTGPSEHTGSLSPKGKKEQYGYYTPADLIVPTKKGLIGLGLKYSKKETPGPEKLGSLGHANIHDALQNFHQAIHGTIDHEYYAESQQSENLNKLTPEEQKHHQEYKSAFVEKLGTQPSSSLSVLRALTNGRLKVSKAKSKQVKTDMEIGRKIRASARNELASHRRRVLDNALAGMDQNNPAHVEAFHSLVHTLMNSPTEGGHIQDHIVSISSGGNVSIQHHRQKATDVANEILKAGPSVSGTGTTINLVGGKNRITVAMSEKGNESRFRLVKGKKQ